MIDSHCNNDKMIQRNRDWIEVATKHYNFIDTSYGNDVCNSLSFLINDYDRYFWIGLPNSEKHNLDSEDPYLPFLILHIFWTFN